ncbi:MAG TPA: hypothetical protein P5530_03520 [Candidatus Diapherotrites archaeon]|jgi:hypothetical protein|nr:hypothetical protein [Candidatus Diapherotrites archaeon]
MSISLAIIGLAIIFIAWLFQFFSMNKRREISTTFIIAYFVGTILLVIDGYKAGLIANAIINGLIAIAAICVLIRFSKPKR